MTAPTTRSTEGTFARTPFANVLLYARENHLSGSFVVQNPQPMGGDAEDDGVGESVVVVESGAVVAVRLPRFSQGLADVRRDLGPTGDDAARAELLRRKLLALFGNPRGAYSYHPDVDLLAEAPDDRAPSPEDVFPLVWRAFRITPPVESAITAMLEKVGRRGVRLRAGHELDRFDFGAEVGGAPAQLRSAPTKPDDLMRLAADPALVRAMLYLLSLAKQIEAVGATPSPSAPPPAVTSTPPPDGVDPKLTEARKHLARMQVGTYFEMFGLKPTSSAEEVRARFAPTVAPWHPDRATTKELRDIYGVIFALYNAAHGTLADPEARTRYEEGGSSTPAQQDQVDAIMGLMEHGHRAEIMLGRKEYVGAEQLLRRVLEGNPDDIAANVLLCRCLIETDPAPHVDDIVVRLAKVLRATDSNDQANYLMGVVLKLKGDRRAMTFFNKALEINPDHLEAQREVRMREVRRERARKANSLVGRFTTWFEKIFGRQR